MSSAFKLTIAEPCHEDWDKMSPEAQGRFCAVCQKKVVDFSGMSDTELVAFFKKPSTGSVCGRFMNDQLERPVEPVSRRKRLHWFRYLFSVTLPALFFTTRASSQMGKVAVTSQPHHLSDTPTACAKDTVPQINYPIVGMVAYRPVHEKPNTKVILPPGKVTVNREVHGKVVDEEGQPVSWASIETGKIGRGTVAKENGEFSFMLDAVSPNSFIYVSAAGFERQAVAVKTFYNDDKNFTVTLKATGWLPEAVVTAYSITCTRRTIGEVMITKADTVNVISNKIKPDSMQHQTLTVTAFKVYPNPVQAGTKLTMETHNLPAGQYTFSVFGMNGQLLRQTPVTITGKEMKFTMNVPASASGTAVIVLQGNGERLTEKIVILK